MKSLGHLLACLVLCLPSSAQITFHATDVPSRVDEDSWRAFLDTSGRNVTQLLGGKGGPRRWDFSYPPAASEDVHQMNVVARDDGGHGGDFAQAAYAERVTRDSDSCQTWSYFKVIAGAGRWYSGFYDACKSPRPAVVFDTPALDLPENLTFGKSWQREVDWQDTLDLGFVLIDVAVHFSNQSSVDAYGTVVLPEIGEVPALRVNEVNSYQTTDLTFGLPLDTQVFRNYFWLVPGIGKAVHVISEAGTSAPPENFTKAKIVLRVFESSRYLPSERQAAKNLRIALKGKEVFIAWDKETGAKSYELECVERLDAESPWSLLESTSDNFYFDAVERAAARFYRVFWVK